MKSFKVKIHRVWEHVHVVTSETGLTAAVLPAKIREVTKIKMYFIDDQSDSVKACCILTVNSKSLLSLPKWTKQKQV